MEGFELTASEVTVAQYRACVQQDHCPEPGAGPYCNWGVAGRDAHPVNCLPFAGAEAFCEHAGGRLPSEAEWEYAARNLGADVSHPWGDEPADCERAVMAAAGVYGCGADGTQPVCSRPAGNTSQGLCDMLGNVWEWTADCAHADYEGAPSDGEPWCGDVPPSGRMRRGGSFDYYTEDLDAHRRDGRYIGVQLVNLGARCAR